TWIVHVMALKVAARAPQTWYVSTSGLDSNTGASAALPWAHAPGMTGATGVAASTVLVPGDIVSLKCGDTWSNTTLTIPVGGSASAQILLNSYGSGAKPIISGPANSAAIRAGAANLGYWTIDGIDLRASGIVPGLNMPAAIYHDYWGADLLP